METTTRRGRPPKKGPLKQATSFRLSVEARQLIGALSIDSGLSQASVVEIALRDMAKQRGVETIAQGHIQSLKNGGELTAFATAQEDIHEYNADELGAMQHGEFETATPRRNVSQSVSDNRSIAERLATLEAFNSAPDNRSAAGFGPVDLSDEGADVYGYTEREDEQR